jgi:hypothetical protein
MKEAGYANLSRTIKEAGYANLSRTIKEAGYANLSRTIGIAPSIGVRDVRILVLLFCFV